MNELWNTIIQRSSSNSRAYEDYTELKRLCNDVVVGNVIAGGRAVLHDWNTKARDSIVVCTPEEAHELFAETTKIIVNLPVLVVGYSTTNRLTVDHLLKVLSTKQTLDVHDFGPPEEGGCDEDGLSAHHPVNRPSAKVIKEFQERDATDGYAYNLLNIMGIKDNPVPACFTNNINYKVLEMSTGDNGKTSPQGYIGDLDSSARFQLLATTGAVHLPHVDRHGVFTTVLNEQGEKVWIVWPNLTMEELEKQTEPGAIPPTKPIAIHIEEGSLLIMPPNCLHAPVTMKTCLMTGTMHWNTSHLLEILQGTKAAIETPAITNEPVSPQFIPKIEHLLNLWRTGNTVYTWPSQSKYDECMEILEVSYPSRLAKKKN